MALAPVAGHKTIKVKQPTVYDQFDFPEYEYSEFPRAIPVNEAGEVQPTPYKPNGKTWGVVHVQDQAEFDALMGGAKLIEVNPTAIESSPKRVETEQDIKDRLLALAKRSAGRARGWRRWSPERMQKALDDHRSRGEVRKSSRPISSGAS